MARQPLVVIGGGEHGRVVIDAARAGSVWEIVGIVDEAAAERTRSLLDVAHLGDDAAYLAAVRATPRDLRPAIVLAIGTSGATGATGAGARRRVVAERYDSAAAGSWATIVHPAAWVSPAAGVAPGVVILAGAVVNAGAEIGSHAIVNSAAVVEHDAVVGSFAHVGPGAIVGGAAVLGEGAYAGMGSLIRDHVSVGPEAFVAMGAVVVADVAPRQTVLGLPARVRPR
jgi:acetyltransferase EpsM